MMTTAKETLDEAKQAHFDAPTGKTLDAVVRAQTALQLEAEQRAQNESLARSSRAAAERAENEQAFANYQHRAAERQHSIDRSLAELVGLERRAAALLLSVVQTTESQQVDYQVGKRLSIALDMPAPLRPPADAGVVRHALQSAIAKSQIEEKRFGRDSRIVSVWLEPAARPLDLSRVV